MSHNLTVHVLALLHVHVYIIIESVCSVADCPRCTEVCQQHCLCTAEFGEPLHTHTCMHTYVCYYHACMHAHALYTYMLFIAMLTVCYYHACMHAHALYAIYCHSHCMLLPCMHAHALQYAIYCHAHCMLLPCMHACTCTVCYVLPAHCMLLPCTCSVFIGLLRRSVQINGLYTHYMKVTEFIKHSGLYNKHSDWMRANTAVQFSPQCNNANNTLPVYSPLQPPCEHTAAVVGCHTIQPQYGLIRVYSKCPMTVGEYHLISASMSTVLLAGDKTRRKLVMCCAEQDHYHAAYQLRELLLRQKCCAKH